MSFEEKVVIITGASSGIGAACAEYYAKEGAFLSLVGRNADKFEGVIEKIKGSGVETEPLVILADVTVDAERIVNETIEKYGRLDILINNAGFAIRGSIESMNMEDFDAVMATNVRGLVELSKLAVPHLIESKGNILNVSSCAGVMTSDSAIAYTMSKAAVDYFTKCLAIDLANKGVRVNALCPGFVFDTDFHSWIGAEKDSDEFNAVTEHVASVCPLKYNGTSEDCVNGAAFLTKRSSSFLTGVLLLVDGGISVKSVM